jgi:hypothetical protein
VYVIDFITFHLDMCLATAKSGLPTEEFVNQKVGEAVGKIGETVFPLRTPLVPKPPNPRIAEYIISRSAQNYGWA